MKEIAAVKTLAAVMVVAAVVAIIIVAVSKSLLSLQIGCLDISSFDFDESDSERDKIIQNYLMQTRFDYLKWTNIMSMIVTDSTPKFKSKAQIAEEFDKFGIHEDQTIRYSYQELKSFEKVL